jgi:Skp family chaperone for outer membrane proteins
MGAITPGTMCWARRGALSLAVTGLMLGPGQGLWASRGAISVLGHASAAEPAILLVSRKRLLTETTHAKALLKAEVELTAKLQRRVDAIKAELTAEEQELTRLRQTMARVEFDARVAQFETDVRRQRREAQQYAAILQNVFRAERLKLLKALNPLLEEVRAAYGTSVILNADQVLVSDPSLDVTDEMIVRFNATVAQPIVPELEDLTLEQAPAPDVAPTSE